MVCRTRCADPSTHVAYGFALDPKSAQGALPSQLRTKIICACICGALVLQRRQRVIRLERLPSITPDSHNAAEPVSLNYDMVHLFEPT
eukprot:5302981-Pyramimonas_sp.AAC.1